MKESIFLCPFDEDSNYNDEFCHNSFLDFFPIYIFFLQKKIQKIDLRSKIGWGGSKIKILKFDGILLTDESPVDKEIWFKKEKSKIRCLWTQLNFIEGLIEFMESLIARKIDFEVNLGFNWKKLKFWGQIIIFDS